MNRKVLVAMSGGVDSSVAAYMLKKQGYRAEAVTMCFGVDKSGDDDNVKDASRVCSALGIKHRTVDFSGELEEKVIKPFINEYKKGRTPNPCVFCNRDIKFGIFIDYARESGFDLVATGHYAAIVERDGSFFLSKPKDEKKDQTYFLYGIRKEYLGSILFPLCGSVKSEVIKVAGDQQWGLSRRPQSQDICFIKDGDYRNFLLDRIGSVKPGKIIDAEGNIIGEHKGFLYYTIGQREGLGIGGGKPYYVISIDAEKNVLVAGREESLGSKVLTACDLNLFTECLPQRCRAKIRYAHKEADCSISLGDNELRLEFDDLQRAVTPGQSVVLYDDDIVIGGGIIRDIIE
ncbi:MAG: tRNA 2-thiouridine(34) synthase MnmA [Candidatus Aureabacteria bacterium]|nr:tRNA 2-thiouridine(34) synthase MnmA [Candidatus Auribacterota bacterium]